MGFHWVAYGLQIRGQVTLSWSIPVRFTAY